MTKYYFFDSYFFVSTAYFPQKRSTGTITRVLVFPQAKTSQATLALLFYHEMRRYRQCASRRPIEANAERATMRRLLDVDSAYYDNSYNETSFLYDSCGIFEYYLELLHRYYIPVMIFVGLIGNFLSCVVFLTTYLKLRSSSYYLAALAIADFSFLVVLTIVNFSYTGIMDLFNKEVWCQVFVYISSVASILSVWLIVAFTVERFIAVQYPLQRPSICTVTRSKMTVCVISALALASQCYVFWTAGVRKNENNQDTCSMIPEQLNAMKVINTIDCITTLIIPFLLIVVMNVMIAKNLYRFSKRMRNSPLEECLTSEKSIDFTKDVSKVQNTSS